MPEQQILQEEVALSKSGGGCFSRLFRLLLCAHSTNTPPIHPSDHLPHPLPQTLPSISSLPNKPNNTNNNPIIPTTPGLVARLMGLDSLPNTSRVSIRVNPPDSVTRSKSVNFIDYLLQFDPSYHQEQEKIHRRVRTSSFREVPTAAAFPPGKDHGGGGGGGTDVVVLSWDDADKKVARESKRREVEKVVGERWRKLEEVGGLRESRKLQRREKKKRKISKLRNEPRRRVVSASTRTRDCGYGGNLSPRMMRKEEFVEPRFRKKLRSNNSSKKMKNEGCSEDFSPVSVLDIGEEEDFPRKKKDNFTDETKGMDLKSKRESSRERVGKSNFHKSETEEFSELMSNLRRLAENDVLLQMFDCVGRKGVFGSDCFDEISLLLEHKIFDLLLHEVLHELLTL